MTKEDRPIKSVLMSDIGRYNYEIVHGWITQGGNDYPRLLNYLRALEMAPT